MIFQKLAEDSFKKALLVAFGTALGTEVAREAVKGAIDLGKVIHTKIKGEKPTVPKKDKKSPVLNNKKTSKNKSPQRKKSNG